MKKNVQALIFLGLFLLPLLTIGQNRKISGTVVSFNRYPLKGITVKAKKAKTEVRTDENGNFEIEVKNNDVLRIKESVFMEYNQKISNDMETLRINLIFENTDKNIEAASDAGFISREDLEFGLRNLYDQNSIYTNFVDIFDAIKYALPETSIIMEDGSRAVQFRGPKSVYGSNAALMLVDGVIVDDVSYINPSEVIRISKLNANAASLYGARAANGVILIETR